LIGFDIRKAIIFAGIVVFWSKQKVLPVIAYDFCSGQTVAGGNYCHSASINFLSVADLEITLAVQVA
jgi:hypothetical protein